MSVRTRSVHGTTYRFDGLVDLLAKATPKRSGDELAGCAATSAAERVAAQWALAARTAASAAKPSESVVVVVRMISVLPFLWGPAGGPLMSARQACRA